MIRFEKMVMMMVNVAGWEKWRLVWKKRDRTPHLPKTATVTGG